jgi:hypothetical protein
LVAGAAFAALALGLVPFAPRDGSSGLGLGPRMAQAQNMGFRVVSGSVVDGNDALVAGATVFLKNLKTKSIHSFTSTDNGKFQFAQVNMAIDYELWAEKGAKKSTTKTVSSWESRKEFITDLKLK